MYKGFSKMSVYTFFATFSLLFTLTTQAEPGWYFGGGIGSGEVEVVGHNRSMMVADFFAKEGIGVTNASGGQPDDTDSFHFMLGYQFNDYFALEGSWYDLGETDGSFSAQLTSDASTITGSLDSEYEAGSFSLVGQYPVFKRVHVLAQAGLHYWRHESTIKGSNATASISASDTEDGTDLLYGVGVKVELGASIYLLGSWTRFDGIESEEGIDVKSISLVYKF